MAVVLKSTAFWDGPIPVLSKNPIDAKTGLFGRNLEAQERLRVSGRSRNGSAGRGA